MVSKMSIQSYFPDVITESEKLAVPKFVPVMDLDVYNSIELVRRAFIVPTYQIFRYNNFLDLLSEYHTSDALNFANVRIHSLYKFVIRQKRGKAIIDNNGYFNPQNYTNLATTEAVLAYFLYSKTRSFMRRLLRESSLGHKLVNHEELVQTNFINYVRFLMTLPDESKSNVLETSDLDKEHYEFKKIFVVLADALYKLRKDEESTDAASSDAATAAIRSKFLLESITKLSYEYILLEKYRFDMETKLHNNYLIDKFQVSTLFNKYKQLVKSHLRENVKVFIYNSSLSLQYGWYLAVSIPFVRFV